MNKYFESVRDDLRRNPKKWLITGVAGFIGSNLLNELLELNQKVIGLDNFLTGHQRNLDDVLQSVLPNQAKNFTFVFGNTANLMGSQNIFVGVDYVLHQAALGSVPRSIEDPIPSNINNVDGFLNVLLAARDANVKRLVYASSSAVYGDSEVLPKSESYHGKQLSPYAVTKYVNELYAQVFAKNYNFFSIGLRYFNVFGPRQDPNGVYSAVIPRWISAYLRGGELIINGDGETTRDFCYIDNVVQANILAAVADADINKSENLVFNIAFGEQTSLSKLSSLIAENLGSRNFFSKTRVVYKNFRAGDIRHSLADISKAKNILGYQPLISVDHGIKCAIDWYFLRQKSPNELSE